MNNYTLTLWWISSTLCVRLHALDIVGMNPSMLHSPFSLSLTSAQFMSICTYMYMYVYTPVNMYMYIGRAIPRQPVQATAGTTEDWQGSAESPGGGRPTAGAHS